MISKRVRVCFGNGRYTRIHNLEDICYTGKHITEGNYSDFNTYDDALAEIKRLNKTPQDCKLCRNKGGWIE